MSQNNALAALAEYPQFIVYRAVPSKDRPGKTEKYPVDHRTAQMCNAQDPATWTSATVVSLAATRFGEGHGVGFVLTENDQFFCLDIDNCLLPDGKTWSPLALSLVARLPGAAVEASISGRGLHVWGSYSGPAPTHACRNGEHGIELYTERRFIAFGHPDATGDASTDCTSALASVVSDFFAPSGTLSVELAEWSDGGIDPAEDDALLEKMLASKSAASVFGSSASFAQLWNADAEALARAFPDTAGQRPYDASRADAALAQQLAYWTSNDCERIKRLMLRSGLRREKYDRPDYLPRTILSAVSRQATIAPTVAKPGAPASDEGWPKPQPIPCSLLPVDPFDNDLLPAALRSWVADIAERMQCPPDFPAVGAMVALSSVIGRKACIRPKRQDDWQVVPNLWGAIVGRPGVMKSPALSEVMKPLDRLAIIAGDLHAEAMREHEIKFKLEGMTGKVAEAQAQKLVAKGNISGAEQLLMDAADAEGNAPPPLRRYKVTDASVEALGEILIENPWGTLAYRDELNGLLRSLDKEGQEGSRAFYLQGYDGNQGYTFDRIMRGRNLHIPAVCIAMLGGIQPGKLQSYIHDAVSGGAGDDGLLQRFGLLVWPDVCGEWRNVDRWPDTPAKNTAFETFQRLDAMAHGIDPESGEEAPVVYRFSTDAQTLFEEWRQEFETALRSGEHHPAMESHLSKYRKLVPAISLVCALADGEAEVSKDSLLRALAWSAYLKTHAVRAYAAGARLATEGATALLAKIKAGVVADGFKPAEVYLKGWSHLATSETVHSATSMLCDLGYLRQVEKRPGMGGGRPSITYQINPATMEAQRTTDKI